MTPPEIIAKVSALPVEFPVRESDEFDQGRLSMRNEVLEILEDANK